MWSCSGCIYDIPMGQCAYYKKHGYELSFMGDGWSLSTRFTLRKNMRSKYGSCGNERRLYKAHIIDRLICFCLGCKFENRWGETKCIRCGDLKKKGE